MFLEFEATKEIARRLANAEKNVSRKIADNDTMCAGGQISAYLGIGRRAIHLIAQSLAESPATGQDRFMDFPSGWGRVTRWIRAAFPDAQIDVSDIKREAVSWNCEEFGTIGFESNEDFSVINAPGGYDIIWVGSLLTHITEDAAKALIKFTTGHLAENGLLLLTSHGRRAVYNGLHKRRALRAFPEEQDLVDTLEPYYHGEYAHREFKNMPGYGMSFTPLAWFEKQLADYDDLTLVEFREKAWNNHQDLVVLRKSGIAA